MAELTPALRERIENTIRFLAVDAVEKAGCGHPGAPMGLARPALELWDRHLRFDPGDPAWLLRDRFVLSAGHASMLLYALLHLYGFTDMPIGEIERFRQLGSNTPGHPEYGHAGGVETTTGPLGQGFAHGVGMALAARMTRSRFGADPDGPGHHLVYGIASDGDMMEGVSNEAASLAGHWGLGNLVYLYDDNRVTIDGPTSLSFSEDVGRRFEALRWHVERVDGEDHEGLSRALEAARAESERPSLLITRTVIGRGSPNKAGKSKAHGEALGKEEVRLTKQALGWPLEPTFLVPDDVRAWFAARAEAKRRERRERDARLEAWRRREPRGAAEWQAFRSRRLPAGLAGALVKEVEAKEDATRKHSGAVLQRLAEAAPFLIGGSGDLTPSNNTWIEGADVIGPAASGPDRFAGRNLHFGVREHAMAAITNGVALDGGFLPYAGTFLIFSDYMRPAVRLAALMGIRSIFVFTHDSIFLGEDGPTHQPIEHLDALRAIPNLTVFRPADGVETAMAWHWIVSEARGPAALVLTRQTVPRFERPASFVAEDVLRGAYPVLAAERPDVVIVASGSEVPLACQAAARLGAKAITARIVSAPCLELFDAQPEAYRRALVPDDGTPLVAVEAGRGGSFWRLVGTGGLVHGIDRFGASAPYKALADAYGFTPEKLAARIEAHLAGRRRGGA